MAEAGETVPAPVREPGPSGYPRPRSSASLPVPWWDRTIGHPCPANIRGSARGNASPFQSAAKRLLFFSFPEPASWEGALLGLRCKPVRKGGVLRFRGVPVRGKQLRQEGDAGIAERVIGQRVPEAGRRDKELRFLSYKNSGGHPLKPRCGRARKRQGGESRADRQERPRAHLRIAMAMPCERG